MRNICSKLLRPLTRLLSALLSAIVLFTYIPMYYFTSYASEFEDEVRIEPYLRRIIKHKLDMPEDDPAPLTVEQLHSVTGRVSVSDIPMRSLEGLQYLTGIDSLKIDRTEVKDFSAVSELKGLKYLYLYENDMEKLPSFDDLDALLEIEAPWNKITDISGLTCASHIRKITLNDNLITKLPDLSSLMYLEKLILFSNKISEIEITGDMPSLTEIALDDNLITDISPLKDLSSLQYLSVRYNKLTGFDPEDVFPYIDDLYIDGNILESYDLSDNFPAITSLGVSDSGLTDFGPLLTHPTIKALYVYNNDISDVSEIASSDNRVIELIDLSNNIISDLSPFADYEFTFPIYLKGNPIDLSKQDNIDILLRLFEKFPEVKFTLAIPADPSSAVSVISGPEEQPSGNGVISIIIAAASAGTGLMILVFFLHIRHKRSLRK